MVFMAIAKNHGFCDFRDLVLFCCA